MPPLCRGKVARKGSPTQGEEIGAGRHRGKQDVCQPGRLTRETARLSPVRAPDHPAVGSDQHRLAV
jgi:hypothetical protein